MRFRDRQEAGQRLAERLSFLTAEKPVIVALPRGGVPIAYEIALQMNAPLDVVIVRKVGHPENIEFGIGALAEDGEFWADPAALSEASLEMRQLQPLIARERTEVQRRVREYRGGAGFPDVQGRTVVLVDDGLATGVTATVAAQMLRRKGAARIVLGVPVCASRSADAIRAHVDEVVCLHSPERFFAVSLWYEDFAQLSDDDVIRILRASSRQSERHEGREVEIEAGSARLLGTLAVPKGARGVVVFAHGSGSSRHSPRNMEVASSLNDAGIATLLFDLLEPSEALDRRNVFDIPLLASRLRAAMRFLRTQTDVSQLPVGIFGASTGGGAAIWAAAEIEKSGERLSAVVSRGGRPDLAEPMLSEVRCPVLLLVGSDDYGVIELNEYARSKMRDASVELIPGATHLFEEPGTLEKVSERATDFFLRLFDVAGERAA